jgi:hypothetical protein
MMQGGLRGTTTTLEILRLIYQLVITPCDAIERVKNNLVNVMMLKK